MPLRGAANGYEVAFCVCRSVIFFAFDDFLSLPLAYLRMFMPLQ